MLMNDKIIFDGYYCINSAQTKEMVVHYILQPRHIFIRVKAFILMLVSGRVQLLHINMCFVWYPVTSISKSQVLIARAHENCYINAWLFNNMWLLISCDTGICALK